VYRDALGSRSLASVLSELPEPVRELVENPPPVSTWVREVHANVVMISLRDVHFASGAAGLADYMEWTRQRNVLLLTRPLYRALFLLLSPERLLRGLERRWSAFRRGTQVHATRSEPGFVELSVRYPSHLYEATALVAALEASGAQGVSVELLEFGEREARYRGSWR
jgi:uncharacterized protein (TIGR02265 family)